MAERTIPVRLASRAPGASTLQTLAAAREDLLAFVPQEAYARAIMSERMIRPWHCISGSQGMRDVLLTHAEAFPKARTMLRVVKGIAGSLFMAGHDEAARQRSMLAPLLTSRATVDQAGEIAALCEDFAPRLGKDGAVAEIHGPVSRHCLQSIARIFIKSADPEALAELVRVTEAHLAGTIRVSLPDLLGLPAWFAMPSQWWALHYRRISRRLLAAMIEENRRAGGHSDLVNALGKVHAGDPNDRFLINNLFFFIFAAHQPTANLIAFAAYLLSLDAASQERAREEASGGLARIRQGENAATALPFLRQVVMETLRLYPPGAIMSEEALKDTEVDGIRVRKGESVLLAICTVSRSPRKTIAPSVATTGNRSRKGAATLTGWRRIRLYQQ